MPGERRFFVKRTALAEAYRPNYDIRRRRLSAAQFFERWG